MKPSDNASMHKISSMTYEIVTSITFWKFLWVQANHGDWSIKWSMTKQSPVSVLPAPITHNFVVSLSLQFLKCSMIDHVLTFGNKEQKAFKNLQRKTRHKTELFGTGVGITKQILR